jgi:hypothetical protein
MGIILRGVEGVSLGIFILGGVVSIVMALVLFWTQHNILFGVLGILSCLGFINFISMIFNLMKICERTKGGAD